MEVLDRHAGVGVEARKGSLEDDDAVDWARARVLEAPNTGEGGDSSRAGGEMPNSVYSQSIWTNIPESWLSRLCYVQNLF